MGLLLFCVSVLGCALLCLSCCEMKVFGQDADLPCGLAAIASAIYLAWPLIAFVGHPIWLVLWCCLSTLASWIWAVLPYCLASAAAAWYFDFLPRGGSSEQQQEGDAPPPRPSTTSMTLGEARRVLELPVDHSTADLKAAFRKSLLKHHPDKNPECVEATAKCQRVIEAHELLEAWHKKAN